MAWEKLELKTNYGNRGKIDYAIRLARHRDGKLAVTLSEAVMREAGWSVGDRIAAFVDWKKKLIGFQLADDDDGRVITPFGGKKKNSPHGSFKINIAPASLDFIVSEKPRKIFIEQVRFELDGLVAVSILRR